MENDAPNIDDSSPHDWKYISEGGSTIVFSYVGPPHPSFDGTALRLRKGPTPAHEDPEKYQKPSLTPAEPVQEPEVAATTSSADDDEPDDPTVVFQRTVIERLVPAAHLPRLQPVRVARAWLAQLAARTEALRPAERRARDAIDLGRRKAVLATDLVGGAGWAVEIKPKWGFLPQPAYLSPETRAIKTRTCRFCMHAHLKKAEGEDVALGYCPLDLYSGDAGRVERALRELWDVWVGSGGAVNNLRVFVQGKMVKPSTDPASLAPLTAQLLPPTSATSPDSEPPAPTHPPDTLRDAFIATLLPLLLDTPVLRTLSTLQRTLDALDIEGLAALWARVHPDAPLGTGHGAADPDIAAWARFVDEHIDRLAQAAEDAKGPGEGEGEREAEAERREVPATEDELRYRVAAYLLGASFKDCSLILRMRPRVEGTMTVIDLDVKSADRLGKWAALDREIVDAYRGVSDARRCVDAHYGAVPLP